MYVIFVCMWICLVSGNQTVTDQKINGYWTPWYDEDTPENGTGDEETIDTLEKRGRVICDPSYTPFSAECRTQVYDEWLVFNEHDANVAPNQLATPCISKGIVCRNCDQQMEVTCKDYQVRFYCVKIGIPGDNHTTIALAAGLIFLSPILVGLIINIYKRYCCFKPKPNQAPPSPNPITVSTTNLEADQPLLFDPPPCYNFLFGQTTSSTGHVISNTSLSNETLGDIIQLNINTLSRSNVLPIDSFTLSETRQFCDRVKYYPGTHLSVQDMYNQYYDSNTPPPSYNDALVILSIVPSETKKTENTQKDQNN